MIIFGIIGQFTAILFNNIVLLYTQTVSMPHRNCGRLGKAFSCSTIHEIPKALTQKQQNQPFIKELVS
jgi:hypothetical protein|tara:strand:- start:48 stop:251 length:204 start_codon:yes stop_codon:yes gene_type:complete